MQQNTRQTRDFKKLWKLHYSYAMPTIGALCKLSVHYQFRDTVQCEASALARTVCYQISMVQCSAESSLYGLHHWAPYRSHCPRHRNDQAMFCTKKTSTGQHRVARLLCEKLTGRSGKSGDADRAGSDREDTCFDVSRAFAKFGANVVDCRRLRFLGAADEAFRSE